MGLTKVTYSMIEGAPVYVQDFGADPTGVIDSTSAIEAAIASASTSQSKTLIFEADAVYKCTSNIDITTNGLRIIGNGATLDGSSRGVGVNATAVYALKLKGSAGENVNITSDITAGDNRINVASTTGIVAGDYILIKSTQQFPSGATGTFSYKGGIYQVRSVTSSTELVLQEGCLFNITALVGGSQNAYINKLTLVENVQIENLKVRMGGKNKAHCGIILSYALAPVLTECETTATETMGVFAEYVVGGAIFGGEFSDATSPAAGSSGITTQYGYGICPGTATKGFVVSGARLKNCRHCVAGGGAYPSYGVVIEKCFVDGTRLATSTHGAAYALDCHEDCLFWVFDSNFVFSHTQTDGTGYLSGDGAIIVRGSSTSVVNNKIYNMSYYGIRVKNFDANTSSSTYNNISGNVIGNCLLAAILIEGGNTAPSQSNHIVSNNIIYDCNDGIILSTANATIVSNNNIKCTSSNRYGIFLDGNSSNRSKDINISNNIISDSPQNSIFVEYSDNVNIVGNNIKNSTDDGINVTYCNSVVINDNNIVTNSGSSDGISIGYSDKVVATGNTISKSTAVSGTPRGIQVFSVNDIIMTSNVLSGYYYGIQADSASDYVIATSCNGRNCTNGSVVINPAIPNKVDANNL